jgi:hypothetical protein
MRGHRYEAASDTFKDSLVVQRQKRNRPLLNLATYLAVDVGPSFALKDSRIQKLDRQERFYIDYCKFMFRERK